jgi:hypothetical protein
LKANSVTTAKIKKNAVTKAKIKNGAVNGAKVADGSLGDADFNLAGTSVARIVHEARGTGTVALGESPTVYPLSNPSYTQEAGRDDTFTGAMDITFSPGCEAPRSATAFVLLDQPNPATPIAEASVVAAGVAADESGGTVSKRISMGPYLGSSFQQPSPTNHTITLVATVDCDSGSGVSATTGAVDVIGVK